MAHHNRKKGGHNRQFSQLATPASQGLTMAKPAQSRVAKNGGGESTPEDVLKYYRDMLLIRRFEEKAGQLYGMGLIGGFCHLYIGQEAVVVGLHSTATDKDSVITTYRDHGHMLAT